LTSNDIENDHDFNRHFDNFVDFIIRLQRNRFRSLVPQMFVFQDDFDDDESILDFLCCLDREFKDMNFIVQTATQLKS